MLFLIICIACFVAYKYLKNEKIKEITEASLELAKEQNVSPDFIYACSHSCVIMDRTQKIILLINKSGIWASMSANEFMRGGTILPSSNEMIVIYKNFDGAAEFKITGNNDKLADIERRLTNLWAA